MWRAREGEGKGKGREEEEGLKRDGTKDVGKGVELID